MERLAIQTKFSILLLAALILAAPVLCACADAQPPAFSGSGSGKTPKAAPQAELAKGRMPEASGTRVIADAGVVVDASNTNFGYVMVRSEPNDKLLKTRVSNGDGAYNYDQRADNAFETYPLQMGDGTYDLQVLEQAEGTMYSRVFNTDVPVKLDCPEIPFLYPNQYVNYARGGTAVSEAIELTSGMTDTQKIVKKLYRYVVDHIEYDYDKAATVKSGYLPSPDETLAAGKGICFDYAALFATMLRARGIPVKLVIGYVAPDNLYHAWNLVYVDGVWQLFDATLDGEGHSETDYAGERVY